jgi:hypothetical protein
VKITLCGISCRQTWLGGCGGACGVLGLNGSRHVLFLRLAQHERGQSESDWPRLDQSGLVICDLRPPTSSASERFRRFLGKFEPFAVRHGRKIAGNHLYTILSGQQRSATRLHGRIGRRTGQKTRKSKPSSLCLCFTIVVFCL